MRPFVEYLRRSLAVRAGDQPARESQQLSVDPRQLGLDVRAGDQPARESQHVRTRYRVNRGPVRAGDQPARESQLVIEGGLLLDLRGACRRSAGTGVSTSPRREGRRRRRVRAGDQPARESQLDVGVRFGCLRRCVPAISRHGSLNTTTIPTSTVAARCACRRSAGTGVSTRVKFHCVKLRALVRAGDQPARESQPPSSRMAWSCPLCVRAGDQPARESQPVLSTVDVGGSHPCVPAISRHGSLNEGASRHDFRPLARACRRSAGTGVSTALSWCGSTTASRVRAGDQPARESQLGDQEGGH